MAFSPGTRFGPYEIAALIGVGGMGEVYRAKDTNLRRDVAIKVLPEFFAGNADSLARFQREAEMLGALNHQNIAHVYINAGKLMSVAIETTPGLRPLAPRELFAVPPLVSNFGFPYAVSPDGKRFLALKLAQGRQSLAVELRVITNWIDELERTTSPATP